MKIFDITLDLKPGMILYPGSPEFRIEQHASIIKGGSTNSSLLIMGTHTGTHVDAPAHIFDGLGGVECLPDESLIGPCQVVYLPFNRHIEVADLKPLKWKGVLRVLFRTPNSDRWAAGDDQGQFHEQFVALTGEAAKFLVGAGLKLVGVDGLSVDRFKSGNHPAHSALLEGGVTIVEGLNLAGIAAGDYELFCGPLKLAGADGAPSRVFLVIR